MCVLLFILCYCLFFFYCCSIGCREAKKFFKLFFFDTDIMKNTMSVNNENSNAISVARLRSKRSAPSLR